MPIGLKSFSRAERLSETSIRRCLSFFKVIDEKGGSAGKWDLIKTAGNETSFRRWVENFLIYHGFIEKAVEQDRMMYKKTEKAKFFNPYLKTTNTSWRLGESAEKNYAASLTYKLSIEKYCSILPSLPIQV